MYETLAVTNLKTRLESVELSGFPLPSHQGHLHYRFLNPLVQCIVLDDKIEGLKPAFGTAVR